MAHTKVSKRLAGDCPSGRKVFAGRQEVGFYQGERWWAMKDSNLQPPD